MYSRQTALLSRLSREDEKLGESESIQTQKLILEQYAQKKGFTDVIHYVDDGYSGTNFERPDFKRLISDIEKGMIGTVITKDLSRLGRDYLKTGSLLEDFFPKHHVRYIALNDDIDTDNGIPEFTPFKNIMNEWYAKDISKKIRSAYKAKAHAGKFTGAYPPYGYLKDPKDKHHLIIDEEIKEIIIQIFTLAKEGKSAYQIATLLKKEKVLKPSALIHQRTGRYYRDLNEKHPYDWAPNTIRGMISKQEYIGNLVCNKHSTISFKSKKLLKLSEDKWIITKGTHEPIINQELFESANKVFYGIIKRKEKTEPMNLFTGMLKCGSCGKNLTVSRPKHRKEAFCCGTYRQFGKEYCSSHYLRSDLVYELILEEIKNHIKAIYINKEKFMNEYLKKSGKEVEKSLSQKNKEMKKIEYRLNELKQITKKLYEDIALNRIDPETYHCLNEEYTKERLLLQEKLNLFQQQLNEQKTEEKGITKFIEVLSKYENLEKLDSNIVHELIKKIVVYDKEIKEEKKYQRIEIHYNFMN